VALGQPALRARIARRYRDRHGIDLDPARVVITSGASGAFILAFSALFDSGARVGIGLPGYPSYRHILHALGMTAVTFEMQAEHRWQPVPETVPRKLDGLLVAHPANPTGTALSQAALARLIDATHAQGAAFISDEIYHGLDYTQPSVTALAVSDDVYVVNSASKYFSMTGWRVGWLVVPPSHVRAIERLAQNMFICTPSISQVALLAALDCEAELESNIAVYRKNRQRMLTALPHLGLPNFAPPDGAFYVYVDVSDFTDNSVVFAREILDEVGVAVTPGLDFDPLRGGATLRLSYAQATSEIEEGLARLQDFLRRR